VLRKPSVRVGSGDKVGQVRRAVEGSVAGAGLDLDPPWGQDSRINGAPAPSWATSTVAPDDVSKAHRTVAPPGSSRAGSSSGLGAHRDHVTTPTGDDVEELRRRAAPVGQPRTVSWAARPSWPLSNARATVAHPAARQR